MFYNATAQYSYWVGRENDKKVRALCACFVDMELPVNL